MDTAITLPRTARRRRDVAPRSAGPAWAAVAAWGAGLLELALGAGVMTSTGGGAGRGAGAVLVIFGIGALGWGAVTLARGRILAPRASIATAIVAIVLAVTALTIDPARTSVAAVGATSALLIAVAMACGMELRRRRRGVAGPGEPRLSALFVAAVLVAGLVTPALGATEAGRLAPDHSDHGIVEPGHH